MFARIGRDNKVEEIVQHDDLTGRYTDEFIADCVPCDETVAVGMVWDGEAFFEPVEPGPVRTVDGVQDDLAALDLAAIRPLRAHIAGTSTDEDMDYLVQNESAVQALRAELAALKDEG